MPDYFNEIIIRYPELSVIEKDIFKAYKLIEGSFRDDGTLFVCGNGGSASDAEHMVGELLKGFKLKREISSEMKNEFKNKFGEEGGIIAEKLQSGLKAVSLVSHPAYMTAFANDVDADLVFAQQLFVLGRKGDVFIGFTTSGNSKNVLNALKVAAVKGIKTIIMTGASGGKSAAIADCVLKMPETETYKVQELHLPVYHALCLALEDYFYGKK